jgi:hypothetical protein
MPEAAGALLLPLSLIHDLPAVLLLLLLLVPQLDAGMLRSPP